MGGITYDASNPKQDSPKIGESIIIGLFFDGTCNNSYNVDIRLAYEKEKKELEAEIERKRKEQTNGIPNFSKNRENIGFSKPKEDPAIKIWKDYEPSEEVDLYNKHKKSGGGDNSYNNDHTNVNKLFESYEENGSTIRKFYIEGIGTTKYKSDDMRDGVGYGCGSNGIRGRVFKACEDVAGACPKTIKYITFDVFGFSRGAAAARNFVHEVNQNYGIGLGTPKITLTSDYVDSVIYLSAGKGVKKNGFLGYLFDKNEIEIDDVHITIRYAGIFDTVPSYDPESLLFPSFEEGAKLLYLNRITNLAKKTIHLVAENEIRENFAITPIVETGDRAKEFILPGVHSDVGGGYVDGKGEKKEIDIRWKATDELIEVKNDLVEKGFFYAEDLNIRERKVGKWKILNAVLWHILDSKKDSIDAKYDRIPLTIMARFGEEYMVEIDKPKMFDKSKIDEFSEIPEVPFIMLGYVDAILTGNFTSYLDYWQRNGPVNVSDCQSVLVDYINSALRMYRDAHYSDFFIPNDELLWYTKQKLIGWIFEGGQPLVYKTAKQIASELEGSSSMSSNMGTIIEAIKDQIVLRRLRRNCMHWSADHKSTLGWSGNMLVRPHKPYDVPSETENSGIDAKYGKRPVYRG